MILLLNILKCLQHFLFSLLSKGVMAAPVHQIMLKGAEKVLRCRDGAEKILRCRDGAEKVLRWCRGAELVVRFLLYPDSIFFPSWGTPQVLKIFFSRF